MSYKVRIDSFEGPFDLLLYLVSRQKVDRGAISITQIADQYLAEVGQMCIRDRLRLVAVARHDEELVAAVAVAVDALVGDGPDAVGHQFQQGVSPAVALSAVHGLQVVDVEEQHAA